MAVSKWSGFHRLQRGDASAAVVWSESGFGVEDVSVVAEDVPPVEHPPKVRDIANNREAVVITDFS